MKFVAILSAFVAVVVSIPRLLSAPVDKKAVADPFEQVSRVALDVTDGQVGESADGFLTIVSPEVRATQNSTGAKAARLVFIFHGKTEEEAKLASGDVALQIGLKLRAKNTCNLLYVMWKLDNNERVAVSVKSNPGMSTHQECGAKGYVNIPPSFQETAANFPSAKDKKPHTLEAQVSKTDPAKYELLVKADGRLVWQGPIDAKLLDDIDGPAGFRSDNGMFTFKFFSLQPSLIKFGGWKLDKKKDRYTCEYRYPSKNSPNKVIIQSLIWYPNDPDRKGYYYLAGKGDQIWARCVCPKDPAFDAKVLRWSKFENKNWIDPAAGEFLVPKDAEPSRSYIDQVPALP